MKYLYHAYECVITAQYRYPKTVTQLTHLIMCVQIKSPLSII